MEVTGFGGRGEYTAGHIQLWLKVGPIASLARFHVVRIEVSYHVLLGRPWLHKHRLVPSTYHQCVKGRLNGKMIRIAANPSPFGQAEAHLVETMFYDQWAPSGENVVAKTQGTFMPRWKDVQDDPEPDLRESKRGNTRVWHVALLKEVWKKKKGRMRQLRQKGTSRLWQRKSWKRLTWSLIRKNQGPSQSVQA